MQVGTVKNVISDRGFLFIVPDSGGGDVFCHFSILATAGISSLQKGDRVEFETGISPRSQREHVTQIRLLPR